MATTTATRAAAGFPVAGGVGNAASKKIAWGSVDISSAPAAADILIMCKLPKGAIIVGGRLLGDRLASGTSGGSSSLGVNIGLDTTFTSRGGTSYATTASMSNVLGTFGPLEGNVVTGVKPESGYNYSLGGLLMSDGPLTLTGEGNALITISSSATSFITGTLTLEVDYYVA
jgi:hypothetical protein